MNDAPSKYANSRIKKIEGNNGTPYLCLFAKSDIPSGQELRYDYDDRDNLWWREQVGKEFHF